MSLKSWLASWFQPRRRPVRTRALRRTRLCLERLEDRLTPSSAGDILWLDQFGGPAPTAESASATDAAGNVYVAGTTSGALPGQTSAGGVDAYVRKYDADGVELWTRQFGSAGFDQANGVAVDASGAVYVTGSAGGALPGQTSAGGVDAYVRKYDADGVELWTRQFGSAGFDQALGVAVDASGAVYLAGSTSGALPGQTSAGGTDAFVRKYDAAGVEVWTRQFGTTATDRPNGVAIDVSGVVGAVYVAGLTSGTLPGQTSAGGVDAYVRKYDADGVELWTRQFGSAGFDQALGVAVDASGAVYLAGSTSGALPGQTSAGVEDAFVRKYDATGAEVWTQQFGTTATDQALGVAVDSSGAVYLAGSTEGALPGQTSAGGEDAFVRKYDAAGAELWTRQFGTTAQDRANGVAIDASGAVYVAGKTGGALPGQTSAGGADAFVRKYDAAGAEVWTRQFGGTGAAVDQALAMATDAAGNVYVAGSTSGALPGQTSAGDYDVYLRKYDADGTELWTRQFGTTTLDMAWGVAVDSSGAVYVAGFTEGTLPDQTSAGGSYLRKYDADGTELWTQQFGSIGDQANGGVAVDASGAVYVAGFVTGALPGQTSAGNQDAYVRKYDADGGELWTRQFGSAANDEALGVAVDASGAVYVAGFTTGALPGQTSAGGADPFVRKYDATGAELWTRQFGTSDSDGAAGVAVDSSGAVYVAGNTDGALPGQTSAGDYDVYLRKYDAAGVEVWTRQFGSAGADQAYGVAVDVGGVYVAGLTSATLPGQTSAGGQDAYVRKYDADGAELWTRQFGSAGADGAFGVAVAASGVYVAGRTDGTLPGQTSAGGSDAFVAKLEKAGAATIAATTTTVTLDAGFVSGSITYDGAAHGATASWVSNGSDGGSGSLDVSYEGTGSTSYAPTSTAPTNAGTYLATATFAGDNTHTGSSDSKNFTITARPITITPNSGQNKVYGNVDPALTFAPSESLLPGNSFSGALGRASGENVGSYAIDLGTLAAGNNYSLSLAATPVKFAISAATPTFRGLSVPSSATAGSASLPVSGTVNKAGAGAIPTGTVTVTVLQGSTPVAQGSQGLSASGAFAINVPISTLPAGSYTVRVSYGGNTNYASITSDSALSIASPYVVRATTTSTKSKNSPSTLQVTLQVFDSSGVNNVGSASLQVKAVGMGTTAIYDPPTAMPATPPSGSPINGPFAYNKGTYTYSLKLVDKNGKPLAKGTYYFYYTVGSDPTVRSLQFVVS